MANEKPNGGTQAAQQRTAAQAQADKSPDQVKAEQDAMQAAADQSAPADKRKGVPKAHETVEIGGQQVRQALGNPEDFRPVKRLDETIPGGKIITGRTFNRPGRLVNAHGQEIDDDGNPLDGRPPILYQEIHQLEGVES